ncbi:response regulator CheY-like domain-containing protein [Rhizobium sp. CIAT894]|uniref:response regulator n=1 Tax=Rhizobium sp. CIAT894 TaxID=2020312 RepID=UPI000A1E1168|nr:response regulator [Rhizobium sp. CIAT894]ARM88242.1 response regulator CheY-like domain-containing protein [Rhizobium sp. CIAT894]
MENSAIELFAGKRVLIVEDEYFLADETRWNLEKAGAVVVGPVARVSAALELVENEEIDAAILDVHLEGEFVFPVAEELERRNIPFVFATAFDPSVIPVRFTGFALCEKPTELGKIAEALFGQGPADFH